LHFEDASAVRRFGENIPTDDISSEHAENLSGALQRDANVVQSTLENSKRDLRFLTQQTGAYSHFGLFLTGEEQGSFAGFSRLPP
jgi:hypothetical protein